MSGPRPIAPVQQGQWTDCGAACLAMALAHQGKRVPLAELRDDIDAAGQGVVPRAMLQAAARHGMSGRAIQIGSTEVGLLPRGAILEWSLSHFVVFDGIIRGGIKIIDPACGPRVISMAEVRENFSGVALVLEPGRRARLRAGRGVGRLLGELVAEPVFFLRILVASLLLRVFALSVPVLIALVVDRVVGSADRHLLWIAALGAGVLVSFDALGSILRAHMVMHLRTRMDTRATLGLLDHLMSLPYDFFLGRRTGDLLYRVSSGAITREVATADALAAIIDGCTALVYAGVIAWVSPSLGLLVLVLAGLHLSVLLLSSRRHRQLVTRDVEAQAAAQGHLVQMLGAVETLKCAGAESQWLGKWFPLYAAQLRTSLERGALRAGVDTVRRALETLAPIGILTIGALAVSGGQLSLGTMLAVTALASGLFGPLSALVASGLQLQVAAGHLDRIDEVLATPREQDEGAAAPVLNGAIAIRQLSYRYRDDAAPAVDEISLDIPKGATVAIVGPSGSGKSTLAALLVGLHRPTDGEIYYDGNPVSQLDVRAVRSQIGMVPQNPAIFAGTVRENIALCAPDAEPGQIEWAARAAGLHDAIASLPNGYDTLLTDGGASLSGGERQRLAIARAILRNPTILVLDEATSALDVVTEDRIMNHLARLGATRIIVAHRLSTIVDADLIVVLDRGRVVEMGDHRDLMARRGLYATLAGGRNQRERTPLEFAS
jgi:ATP-binding cassette, subfamily B, bacterial